jgi:hypothetical protein
MISDVLFYTLLLMGGAWLGLLLYWVWPYDRAVSGQRPSYACHATAQALPRAPTIGGSDDQAALCRL